MIRLQVNGTDYAGWKAVGIIAGIDRAAREFELAVTDKWPGNDVARRIAPGDLARVFIGDDLVVTGYVDATPIRFDGREVTVGINGRSLTADLVDCSAINEPGQWRGRRIEQIAADLAQPYGVKVAASAATGAAIADHQIQQGETVFESVDRMLALRSLLATDDAEGRLVLTRAAADRATTALVVGENVLSGSAGLDFKDRYSEYIVKGQRAGDDDDFAGSELVDFVGSGARSPVSQAEGRISDAGVRRRRALLIVAEGQADIATARDRARWEATFRAGKSYEASYTVQGWRQGDGRLWAPNQLVHVRDPIIGFDLELLITEVTYSDSDGAGQVSSITVAPAAAYELRDPGDAVTRKERGAAGTAAGQPGETVVKFE